MKPINNDSEKCKYDLMQVPADTVCGKWETDAEFEASHTIPVKWGAYTFDNPPAIGTRVRVTINGLGYGKVEAYFVEHGWLGVRVRPESRPAWHLKQNGPEKDYYLLFGREIEPAN